MIRPVHVASPRWLQRLAALLLMLAAHASAWALRDHITYRGITAAEHALLPEWCIDTQGGPYGNAEGAENLNRSPRARQWVAMMGQDFWHLHHYCWALRDMRRAAAADTTRRERDFLYERAVTDLVYTINNCLPTMPLMPEVLLKLGDVYLLQKNFMGAEENFRKARALMPAYWPAYTHWADYLISLKLWDRARTLLEEGLAHAPDSTAIKERLQALPKAGSSATSGSAERQGRATTRAASRPATKPAAP